MKRSHLPFVSPLPDGLARPEAPTATRAGFSVLNGVALAQGNVRAASTRDLLDWIDFWSERYELAAWTAARLDP